MEFKLMFLIFFLSVLQSTLDMNIFTMGCNPRERKALLNFKHDQRDPSNYLYNWVGKDCCEWNGVTCNSNKIENYVIELDLGSLNLSGKLNPSLLELKHLIYLDLSYNNFGKIEIPPFLGSLGNLRYLNLASAGFTGKLPPQLGNLSRLNQLDLSWNELEGEIPRTLGNLSRLNDLDLSVNELEGEIPRTWGDLSRLNHLDLSYNKLEKEIPRTLGNLCNLEILDLSKNKLEGEMFGFLRNSTRCLKNLTELYLWGNALSGSIPIWLGKFSSLTGLDLRDNKLTGSLPESLGHLSNLESLQISGNTLEGFLIEAHLANLTKLDILDISSLVLNLRQDWVPPFQLTIALMRNCSVGRRIPQWLRTQKHIEDLDISNARISGFVPSWFWNMSSTLSISNISHNQIEGDLSKLLLKSAYKGSIYLNSNRFTGNLPLISSNILRLHLSKNSFSGPISALLCSPVEDMKLITLELSENLLSGEIPDCWFHWRSLLQLSFNNNNITGEIPTSMGSLRELQALHLQNNSLYGELPSLRNCTELKMIDLGENRLTGGIPTWIGESLKELVVLRLHSNKFLGGIPRELCYLTMLQIMDLGHNNISGSIPRCFSNFTRMVSKRTPSSRINSFSAFIQKIEFDVKGQKLLYGSSLLELVAGIDLSDNNLYGEIPEELTNLFGLQILNLAKNHFTGKIPNRIGLLGSLESLDLSYNSLSGLIPQTIVNLNFLSYLNLSYNNLSGEIPLGTQLQSFSELSYVGNHDLCGPPLKNCDGDEQPGAPNSNGERSTEDNEDWFAMKWFYMGLPFGFVVGFWCLWGVLLVNKSWRYTYFAFVDDIIYKLCGCLMQR